MSMQVIDVFNYKYICKYILINTLLYVNKYHVINLFNYTFTC